MGTTFLHLSDLHLGDDIIARALLKGRSWKKHVQQKITDGLIASIEQLGPDYIVISGDFVNKPAPETFLFAGDYLRKVFLKTRFDVQNRLFVIPGNHDVSLLPKKPGLDFERVFTFRKFLCHLFDVRDIEAYRHNFIRVLQDERIIVIGLDSTLKTARPMAEGEIGGALIEWVKKELRQIAAQLNKDYAKFAKIAILHHHCKSIPNTPIQDDRLMQLLDAGDVLNLFAEVGVNVVLHGHRHVPRITPEIRSDSSCLTVVGAGTATCAFPEEQHGYGNNFNFIRVSPEKNQLTISLYRANEQTGVFGEVRSPATYPLFKLHAQGYSTHLTRKVVKLFADGTTKNHIEKLGLRVEDPALTMNVLPLRVVAMAPTAKITDFEYDKQYVTARCVTADQSIQGDLVFRTPLTMGSAPVDVVYSYCLRSGTAMSQAQATKFDAADGEWAAIVVSHPMQALRIEVIFPDGYQTDPRFTVERLGAEIHPDWLAKRTRAKYDRATNLYSLEVDEPPLDHTFYVRWTLPPTWP